MKFRERKEGERIEVDDVIHVRQIHDLMPLRKYRVTRTTNNFAFAYVNENHDIKVRRVVDWTGVRKVPRPQWPENRYSAWTSEP